MNVFALDFDGVLCDSAPENAVSAWRALAEIRSCSAAPEPPVEFTERFVRLRPQIETGYQTILLAGLLCEGVDEAAIAAHFPQRSEQLRQRIRLSRDELAERFARVRDEWIARDLEDWLNRHRFYPVLATFIERLETDPIFILTTKAQRFAEALLEGRGIAFPAERLFGLDAGRRKEEILEDLLARPEYRNASWHFVEDRLGTLLRVARRERLREVRLYLAGWGYNTPEDREQARRHPAITLWSPEAFLVV